MFRNMTWLYHFGSNCCLEWVSDALTRMMGPWDMLVHHAKMNLVPPSLIPRKGDRPLSEPLDPACILLFWLR